MHNIPVITVVASGANRATAATSANVALPNASNAAKARFYLLQATANCYVKLGLDNTVTAAAGDLLVQAAVPLIVARAGHTHIAAIRVAADGILNITPLED